MYPSYHKNAQIHACSGFSFIVKSNHPKQKKSSNCRMIRIKALDGETIVGSSVKDVY